MSIETFRQRIEDAECELEELAESGDLEERMEAALRLADLQQQLVRHEAANETGFNASAEGSAS